MKTCTAKIPAYLHCKRCPDCDSCPANRETTNADLVRAMNDEELAEVFYHACHSTKKPLSKNEVLAMLKQPAKEMNT